MLQDKIGEMDAGSLVPDDKWLDNPKRYHVKKTHLEVLHAIPSKGKLVLDAGCGPGTYGMILAEEGNRVVGIDISPPFVVQGRERGRKKSLTFMPQLGDLERLPFKDNSFDTVFAGWVLHHFPDTTMVVQELYRVLKPGGLFALAEPNEANIIARFSRFVEDLPLLRRWVLAAGWDTPNRASHAHHEYATVLGQQGFTNVQVTSWFHSPLPALPSRSPNRFRMFILHFLFGCRSFMFSTAARLLPASLSGNDLLITATKEPQALDAVPE